jgi:hypothetical protein
MSLKAMDAITLKKYLLGQLTQDELETVELWLLTENDAYDLIAAAEDDLIDDSIAGRLNAQEEPLFRSHFLAAPERQRKLQFAEAFNDFLARQQMVHAPSRAPSIWEFFRYRPVFATAAAVMLVMVVGGAFWTARLQTQLNSTTSQMTQAELQREELNKQLSEARSQTERMTSRLATLEKFISDFGPSVNSTALNALSLMPAIRTRSVGDGELPTTTITPKTQLLRFSLALPENNYSSYRVLLVDDGDGEIWRMEQVGSAKTVQGDVVVLIVPSDILSDGDYKLKVMVSTDPAPPEGLANYYFRVVHAPAKQ